jgi:hypothetical protein
METMPQPPTKLSLLKRAARAGNWVKALAIAAKFPELGAHKAAIQRARQCAWNPGMYKQMGWDTDQAIAAGIAALKERYQL